MLLHIKVSTKHSKIEMHGLHKGLNNMRYHHCLSKGAVSVNVNYTEMCRIKVKNISRDSSPLLSITHSFICIRTMSDH
uniref:Uncharacterized protein n=1 Tax=Anguilla anguilla TaxID=7936 RepID=A0A0E9WIR3_ANGAN